MDRESSHKAVVGRILTTVSRYREVPTRNWNRMSAPIALHPARMTAAQRLAEIGRILAVGYLRARTRRLGGKPTGINALGEISLDFPAPQRGHDDSQNRSHGSP